jgi:branched-subunit amino acid ABC-type transport system permease component
MSWVQGGGRLIASDGSVDIFIQQLINGLVLGSMYALVALGYTMVYGIINLINFAHGEVLMVGALVSWTVVTALAGTGWPGWVLLLISLVAAMALIHGTSLGRAMRATAENPRVAQLMGVQPDRIISATFIIGAGLAALAGVMWAANYGSVQHTMGFLPGLKAFTAAVFGGIGNLAGAMVGGLLLGVIEALGAGYIGDLTGGVLGSNYQDIFAFTVLILVLTLRPQGLLGERVADRA